jgi:GT2 family glycosyltransferase
MSRVNVSIIIVSYNVKELLLACLRSVYDSNEPGVEIIVVDNVSQDGSADAVRNAFPGVMLIENKENRGFSAANNQGMAAASGTYIFLLNPDTELLKDALHTMLRSLEHIPGLAIVAPQLLNADGTVQASAWWYPTLGEVFFRAVFLNKLFCMEEYAPMQFEHSFAADGLSGAALMFSRSVYEKLGNMDEELFWMEDVDLCYRNNKAGGKNIYLSPAKVKHYSGQSTRKNYRVPVSNQLISKLKFFRKHGGVLKMSVGALFVLIHIVIRLVFLLPGSLISSEARKKTDAYFYTLKKLFRYLFAGDKSIL